MNFYMVHSFDAGIDGDFKFRKLPSFAQPDAFGRIRLRSFSVR
jgi:hypothetical protein